MYTNKRSGAVERLILSEFQRELSPGRAPSSGRAASQERAASRDDPSHDTGRPRDDRRRQDVKRRQDGASCDEHRPDDDQRLQDPPTVTKRGYPITDDWWGDLYSAMHPPGRLKAGQVGARVGGMFSDM